MAIEIIDTLVQKNGGKFPLVDSNNIKGGFYQVKTLKDRDNIPNQRRQVGMFCYVEDDDGKIYQLNNNDEWVLLKLDSDIESLALVKKIEDNKTIISFTAKDKEISSVSIDTMTSLSIGGDAPDGDSYDVWIDTSEVYDEINSTLQGNILDEFKAIFQFMSEKIERLENTIKKHETRISYLEEFGGGWNPDDGDKPDDTPNISTSSVLILEDNSILTFEDGSIMVLEDDSYKDSNDIKLLFENNEIMVFEDGYIMTFEASSDIDTDTNTKSTKLLFESDELMTFEDNYILIAE